MKTAEILLHPSIILAGHHHVEALQRRTGMMAVVNQGGTRGALVRIPANLSIIKRNQP